MDGNQAEPSAPQISEDEIRRLFNAPEPAKTLLEGLEQRINKFKQQLDSAKTNNDMPKIRRLGRIIKSYENAIASCKAGKPFDYDSLVCPAGYPELPPPDAIPLKSTATLPNPTRQVKLAEPAVSATLKPQPTPTTELGDKIGKASPKKSTESTKTSKMKPELQRQLTSEDINQVRQKLAPKASIKRSETNLIQHINFLKSQQEQFKLAALAAKKKGDIELAKHYLRQYKGFEPIITAVNNGLPVDWSSIPKPPRLKENSQTRRSNEEFSEILFNEDERDKYLAMFETELESQLEFCLKHKEQYERTSDSGSFEACYKKTRSDMILLQTIKNSKAKIPRIGYMRQKFLMVMVDPNIGANQLMLHLIKCVDLNCNDTADIYIKILFPFPSGETQTAKSKVVYNSRNPVFDEKFIFNIDRKARSLPRIFKRHPITCEVYIKGGFLRSDTLLGTGSAMMTELATKSMTYQTCDLKCGKKPVGGRIEVKIHLREPLSGKEIVEVDRKWLMFE